MRKIEVTIVACVAMLAAPAPVLAQEGQHAQHAEHAVHHAGSMPLMEALIADVEQAEQKLVGLAEAIPESAWGWRPAEGVRSVGEVMMHVSADNYFIPAFAGVTPPASTGISGTSYPSVQAYEARQLDKAATLAELRVSFEHLKAAMRAVDHDDLMAELDVFGTQMTGLRLWVLTATHLHEHLGQSIAYARSNGVVPPWSQANN